MKSLGQMVFAAVCLRRQPAEVPDDSAMTDGYLCRRCVLRQSRDTTHFQPHLLPLRCLFQQYDCSQRSCPFLQINWDTGLAPSCCNGRPRSGANLQQLRICLSVSQPKTRLYKKMVSQVQLRCQKPRSYMRGLTGWLTVAALLLTGPGDSGMATLQPSPRCFSPFVQVQLTLMCWW